MRKRLARSIVALFLGMSMLPAANAQHQRAKTNTTETEFIEPPGFSLGLNLGMTDLWGDVGTASPVDHYNNSKYWESPKFMGGIYGRYTPHPALVLRLGFNYGTLYASDNFNKNQAEKAKSIESDAFQRYLRNLNVKTALWEGYFLLEFNPLRTNVYSHRARKRFQPYALLGIGGFHFNPRGEYTNPTSGQTRWIDLYDLHLEGDDFKNYADAPKKYSLWQMSVPMGIGVRWDIGNQLGFGFEYLYRYLFTDYLDNVSDKYIDPSLYAANLSPNDAATAYAMADKSYLITGTRVHGAGELRGNKSVADGYSTLSVTFFYKIKSKKTPWWYQGSR